MNLLDLVLVLIAITAAIGGYRLGFLVRAVSWLGLVAGLLLATTLLPGLLRRLHEASDVSKLLVVVATLLGLSLVGQGLGMTLGSRLHIALPAGPARRIDRVAGAVSGTIGVLVLLWLMLPTLASAPGWTAEQARNSLIASEVDTYFPNPPDAIEALRRVVGEESFPQVLDALEPAPDLGPAPGETGLSQQVVNAAASATVKVQGIACDRVQEGTGFVVADELVVTNAHVVAGEDATEVVLDDGRVEDAEVVAFDPVRDLAVLRVDGLDRGALPVDDAEIGEVGGVFGHPGGGDLEISPFQVGDEITAVGKDIYDRQDSRRQVLVLAAELRPGDSGSALVNAQGEVIGVAFAVAPDRSDVAYALTRDELRAVIEGDLTTAKDTGDCLV